LHKDFAGIKIPACNQYIFNFGNGRKTSSIHNVDAWSPLMSMGIARFGSLRLVQFKAFGYRMQINSFEVEKCKFRV